MLKTSANEFKFTLILLWYIKTRARARHCLPKSSHCWFGFANVHFDWIRPYQINPDPNNHSNIHSLNSALLHSRSVSMYCIYTVCDITNRWSTWKYKIENTHKYPKISFVIAVDNVITFGSRLRPVATDDNRQSQPWQYIVCTTHMNSKENRFRGLSWWNGTLTTETDSLISIHQKDVQTARWLDLSLQIANYVIMNRLQYRLCRLLKSSNRIGNVFFWNQMPLFHMFFQELKPKFLMKFIWSHLFINLKIIERRFF